MPANVPAPMERLSFDAATLMAEHPPVLRHTNKLVVFNIACPQDCEYGGTLGYTRWAAMPLPQRIDAASALARVENRPTIFDYAPTADVPGAVEWHVNFADPYLFFAYGTGLFAQDEMQSAEHPVLGALVEAMHEGSSRAMTEDEKRHPTPVLVTGVERRCSVAIDRNEAEGRPRGLYGDAFSAAPVEAVRRATTPVQPPTVSNLIALAAPSYGMGAYTREQIAHILVTAYTGFVAAMAESARMSEGAPVVIHTGFWGCGVFGGNRVMMSLLQVLAAGMAGVDRLVFHTVTTEGGQPLDQALAIVGDTLAADGEIGPDVLLDRIVGLGIKWGMSDGN